MKLYTILDNHTWVATDELMHYAFDGNKKGSLACRALLIQLQQQLNLTSILQEQHYPYYFDSASAERYFVSFSHSRQHIAIIISRYRQIGIDIEDNLVSKQVAMRFFSTAENDWLNTFNDTDQQKLRNILWCLKESYIKANNNPQSQLISGIKNPIFDKISHDQIIALLHQRDLTICQITGQSQELIGYITDVGATFVIISPR